MGKFLAEQHVHQLSEIDSGISLFVDQVTKTRQPILFKNNGKNKAVLLDISKYEELLDELALLKDIRIAEEQLQAGQYLTDEEASYHLQN